MLFTWLTQVWMPASYICEISPTKHRGPLASMVQLFITLGLVVGYFTCYGTVKTDSSFSWRFPFSFQAALSLLLTIASWLIPESPRWLNHKGRAEEAKAAWKLLGIAEPEVETVPLATLHPTENRNEISLTRRERMQQRFQSLQVALKRVMGPSSRKPALLAIFLMSMQQLSGIDGVLYVSLVIL